MPPPGQSCPTLRKWQLSAMHWVHWSLIDISKMRLPIATAGLRITDLTAMPIREVRTRVANLPPRTAIIYPGMYSDGEGTFLTPVEALRRFADVANRPIVVTVETQIGAGGIGGYIASPSALGQAAASIVIAHSRGRERYRDTGQRRQRRQAGFRLAAVAAVECQRIPIAARQRNPIPAAQRMGSVSLADHRHRGRGPAAGRSYSLAAIRAPASSAFRGCGTQHAV